MLFCSCQRQNETYKVVASCSQALSDKSIAQKSDGLGYTNSSCISDAPVVQLSVHDVAHSSRHSGPVCKEEFLVFSTESFGY